LTEKKPIDWVEVGFVARAHGVRGELRVHTDDAEAILAATELKVGDSVYQFRGRGASEAVLVFLDGVTDRDVAAQLKGSAVSVPRSALGLLEDEILLQDLVGFSVWTQADVSLGVVRDIELGPQDRLIVASDTQEMLIPVVDALLLEIDADKKRITVDLPEGMPIEGVGGKAP